jgi:hypothetical protein
MVTVGSEPSEESLVVAESGATVALSDVEPESGGEPGPAAPLGRVAVVAPARAAGLVAGFPEAAEGPAVADAPGPGATPEAAASEDPADGELVMAPTFGEPALQAVSATATTRSEALTAALARKSLIIVTSSGSRCRIGPAGE